MIEYNNNSILLRISYLETHNAYLHYILGTNFDYLTIMLPESLKLCISGFFMLPVSNLYGDALKQQQQKILLLHQTHLSPLLPPAGHQLMVLLYTVSI